MKAVINVSTQEFDLDFFNKLKSLFSQNEQGFITISFNYSNEFDNDKSNEYENHLKQSIQQLEEGKTIKFTEENFKVFTENFLAN